MKKILLLVLCCLCICGCNTKDIKNNKNNKEKIFNYVKEHHPDMWTYDDNKLTFNNNTLQIKMYNVEHWTDCATASNEFIEELSKDNYSNIGINKITFECLDPSQSINSYVTIENLSDINNDFYKKATFLDNNKNNITQNFEDGLKQAEDNFKQKCESYEYKEILRNPENYKGKKIKVTGEVIQVMETNNKFQLRVNMTKNKYDFYEDTIFIQIEKDKFNGRIIEKDIITFWGISGGTVTYTTVLGVEITIPAMETYYAELIN